MFHNRTIIVLHEITLGSTFYCRMDIRPDAFKENSAIAKQNRVFILTSSWKDTSETQDKYMDKQKNTKLGYSINTFMLFAVNQQPFSSTKKVKLKVRTQQNMPE